MRSDDATGMRATQRQLERQHIFVVNGSVEFLDIVRELLQGERYNVTTTNFVPDTFDQIEAARPSLLIVDLVVGEKVGWSLLARLNEEASTRQLPIILVSTTPDCWTRRGRAMARSAGTGISRSPSTSTIFSS